MDASEFLPICTLLFFGVICLFACAFSSWRCVEAGFVGAMAGGAMFVFLGLIHTAGGMRLDIVGTSRAVLLLAPPAVSVIYLFVRVRSGKKRERMSGGWRRAFLALGLSVILSVPAYTFREPLREFVLNKSLTHDSPRLFSAWLFMGGDPGQEWLWDAIRAKDPQIRLDFIGRMQADQGEYGELAIKVLLEEVPPSPQRSATIIKFIKDSHPSVLDTLFIPLCEQGEFEAARLAVPLNDNILRNCVNEKNINATRLALEYGADPNSALAEAAGTSVEYVRLLLDAGANPAQTGGQPVVVAACDPEILGLLLEAGGDPNSGSRMGFTGLTKALSCGSLDSMRLFAKYGVRPDPDSNGRTPMHYAAIYGNARVLKRLAASLPGIIDERDADGLTPLHWAAFLGNTEITAALLKLKADPEAVDESGRTPLFYAAFGGGKEMTALLLESLGEEKARALLRNTANNPKAPLLFELSRSSPLRYNNAIRIIAELWLELDNAGIDPDGDKIEEWAGWNKRKLQVAALLLDKGARADLILPDGTGIFQFMDGRGVMSFSGRFPKTASDDRPMLAEDDDEMRGRYMLRKSDEASNQILNAEYAGKLELLLHHGAMPVLPERHAENEGFCDKAWEPEICRNALTVEASE